MNRPTNGFPRHGTVYVAVLGTAMIVSMIGLCAIHVARIELRNAASRRDTVEARMLAQSAVEFALGRIDSNSDWRVEYEHGEIEPSSPLAMGNGTIEFVLNDAVDKKLDDNDTDPVEILGIGRVGAAVFVYQANYAPNAKGVMAIVPGGWMRTTEP
jgi:Tfp pilus assembly protein PilX